MRFEGVLTAWNSDAGYGRIRPARGGDEVFVALGAFPTDGDGPRLNEPLSFEIVTGRDGRKQAVSLQRLALSRGMAKREVTAVGHAQARRARRKRGLTPVAGAVIAVMLVLGGLNMWPAEKPADAVPVTSR
jgi:cold shock CspA family protein